MVTTTSSELGDLWIKPHASYMSYFGGTSSANPIVAGATASLSGFAKAHNLILKPKELRRILVETGMPLANNDSAKVGTQPNLEKAFKKILLSEVEVPTVAVSRSTINAVVAHDTEVLYPISATSNQQGNVNWQWERISGDSRIFIKDSSAAETQVVIPKNLENVSTRFRVTATNSQGKKAGSDVEINVTSPKVTIVGTSIMESIHPLTLKASANFDQVVYNWSLSKDGQNVPKGINASGIIKSNLPAGDYIVKVEARSDKGQRHAQATHRVKITLDDLTGTPAWDKDKVYSTPCTEVRYNGSIWKNGWWTKNEAPDSESPWGVWRKKGSANMHAGC
ncbi:hypothetical protein GPZ83_0013035 [Serratia symbiotica]|nr:hypothetical protein GPZ83_0013035 [Serratia symbiotica]